MKAPFAKLLKGFGGAGVLEVVDDFNGNAYRSVCTVRFAGVVYVLHAFQKKPTRGISTPPAKITLDRVSRSDHFGIIDGGRPDRTASSRGAGVSRPKAPRLSTALR